LIFCMYKMSSKNKIISNIINPEIKTSSESSSISTLSKCINCSDNNSSNSNTIVSKIKDNELIIQFVQNNPTLLNIIARNINKPPETITTQDIINNKKLIQDITENEQVREELSTQLTPAFIEKINNDPELSKYITYYKNTKSNDPTINKLLDIILLQMTNNNTRSIGEVINDYDRRAVSDKLTPPRKLDDTSPIPPNVLYPNLFGQFTRGEPGKFRKMGYLTDLSGNNEDKYKFLTLMGRQKYPNSSRYEYYITSNDKNDNFKIELGNIRKELDTGDTLSVSELGKDYKVTIDKNIDYEYSPYLF